MEGSLSDPVYLIREVLKRAPPLVSHLVMVIRGRHLVSLGMRQ
jgi:hypothetical protein